jgi:hypothetical protein
MADVYEAKKASVLGVQLATGGAAVERAGRLGRTPMLRVSWSLGSLTVELVPLGAVLSDSGAPSSETVCAGLGLMAAALKQRW